MVGWLWRSKARAGVETERYLRMNRGLSYSPSVLLELLFDVSDHPITTVSMRLP